MEDRMSSIEERLGSLEICRGQYSYFSEIIPCISFPEGTVSGRSTGSPLFDLGWRKWPSNSKNEVRRKGGRNGKARVPVLRQGTSLALYLV
jgi:hypothetical protein